MQDAVDPKAQKASLAVTSCWGMCQQVGFMSEGGQGGAQSLFSHRDCAPSSDINSTCISVFKSEQKDEWAEWAGQAEMHYLKPVSG